MFSLFILKIFTKDLENKETSYYLMSNKETKNEIFDYDGSHYTKNFTSKQIIYINNASNGFDLNLDFAKKDLKIQKNNDGYVIQCDRKDESGIKMMKIEILEIENEIEYYEINEIERSKTYIKFNFTDKETFAQIKKNVLSESIK